MVDGRTRAPRREGCHRQKQHHQFNGWQKQRKKKRRKKHEGKEERKVVIQETSWIERGLSDFWFIDSRDRLSQFQPF